MITISEKIIYPEWCKVTYNSILDQNMKSYSFHVNGELIGYAVVVFNYDYESQCEKVQNITTFLASFEVKYKRKGYGSQFLKLLIPYTGPMILYYINDSGPFYYQNGAYILDDFSLYDPGIMAIGLTDLTKDSNMNAEHCRVKCEECNFFHLVDCDECY